MCFQATAPLSPRDPPREDAGDVLAVRLREDRNEVVSGCREWHVVPKEEPWSPNWTDRDDFQIERGVCETNLASPTGGIEQRNFDNAPCCPSQLAPARR